MANESEKSKDQFLNPVGKYYGKFTPGNLAFNANLQEFANRVSYICSLETSGKIPTEEAYKRIKNLWNQLESSKEQLLNE